jgi:hypothetical protein
MRCDAVRPCLTLVKHLIGAGALVLLLVPRPAGAASVTVGCPGAPGGPYDYASLSEAIFGVGPHGPNVITVEGVCHNEPNPLIIGFWNLTVIAGPAGATISRDLTACGGAPTSDGSRVTLSIIDSQSIVLTGLVVSGGRGIGITDGSSVNGLALTVQNSLGNGIGVSNSSLSLGMPGSGPFAGMPTVVQDHCGSGISAGTGASVALGPGTTVQGNSGSGLFAAGDAGLNGGTNVATPILIQNNQLQGVAVNSQGSVNFNGEVIIQNNALAGGQRRAAIVSFGGVIGVNSSGLQVVDNQGAGIEALTQSTIRLAGPSADPVVTISGNTGPGINLSQMSMAWVTAATSVTGNGAGNVTCDSTSNVFGDDSGILQSKCKAVKK